MNEPDRVTSSASRAPAAQRVRVGAAEMREALVDGFRSGRLPSVADATATVFSRADARHRAALLSFLLRFVSPLALGVLAAGQFAKYMFRDSWKDGSIPLEDIRQVAPGQVAEIARYVEQSNPEVVRLLSGWLSTHPGALFALGAGAIAVLLQFVAGRRAAASASTRANHAPGLAPPSAGRDARDPLDD